jgi:hypothetical protein
LNPTVRERKGQGRKGAVTGKKVTGGEEDHTAVVDTVVASPHLLTLPPVAPPPPPPSSSSRLQLCSISMVRGKSFFRVGYGWKLLKTAGFRNGPGLGRFLSRTIFSDWLGCIPGTTEQGLKIPLLEAGKGRVQPWSDACRIEHVKECRSGRARQSRPPSRSPSTPTCCRHPLILTHRPVELDSPPCMATLGVRELRGGSDCPRTASECIMDWS